MALMSKKRQQLGLWWLRRINGALAGEDSRRKLKELSRMRPPRLKQEALL